MIEISHLTHIYPGSRKSPPRTAIDDLSLSIETGEFCILSGPNGSGKSTLFRILCGMALPSAGTIRIGGRDLFAEPAEARAQMAVVFQSPAVDKYLSVAENLRLHAALYGLKGGDYAARLEEAIGWTDLKDRLADKVETLSGGLARQVELAKCLLTRPAILLLDEPTTGLDPNSRRNFVEALHKIQRDRKMTVLMTSHIFSEAEDADRVAIMKDGRLLALDSPQALRAQLGHEMVVLQSRHATLLRTRIATDLGLKTRQYGDELRLEETSNGDSLPILEKLLSRYRGEIDSIAIKQPALEDVFIHLTGKTGDSEDEQLETLTR
ncbi:ABC transporter ATP-binding protein [Telmatospirillum sp.]|uniref:ABC transporter ATP-binding protein n=1 Tax=Telmatospirillum sp. TaxID=2079197 RepID=UPI002847AA0F|nr:ABC transporter ATP-binding protein [Telmatospirillum sp.]MDR3436124.1 ABC transporter ATP-binding protein [Telmatospirillum sp.]